MNPQEVVKLALLYRTHSEYEKAEQLLRNALVKFPNDPLLFNALARLFLFQDKMDRAIEHFKKDFYYLHPIKGIYNKKAYLDPAMNLAKLYIISSEYDLARDILKTCWQWADEGKNESFLRYEEFGWYLIANKNAENASDILLYVSEFKKFDNHAMRWLTIAVFFADMIRFLAPKLARRWLEIEDKLENFDAIAMSLCCLYSPPSLRADLLKIIEKDFLEVFQDAARKHNIKSDWYKTDEDDHAKLLAGVLDISTTGGVFSDTYKSLFIRRLN
jgi:tetratricopeptide (TPR) repeat protein